jgi:hypothetical protein
MQIGLNAIKPNTSLNIHGHVPKYIRGGSQSPLGLLIKAFLNRLPMNNIDHVSTHLIQGMQMPIPEELFELLANEKNEHIDLHEKVIMHSSDDWIDAINDERLEKRAKLNLLKILQGKNNMLPVMARLSNQSGFGILVAREIMSDKRWPELMSLAKKSGINDAVDSKSKELAIANIVVDKGLMFWVFNIMFSKNFIKGISSIVYDSESEVRKQSIEFMALMDGELVKESLINALDDTNDKISSLAKNKLREKYSEAEVNKILSDRDEELSSIRKAYIDAKDKIELIVLKLPGLSFISSALNNAVVTATNASSGVTEKISEITSDLIRKFKKN